MKTNLRQWLAAALVAGAGVWSARAAMTHTAATLDTREMVLAEILPETCTYETVAGECTTLTVTFTADLAGVGPFVLPDGMGPLAFDVNGRTISGKAGTNGDDGSPVFRVGSGTTITITGDVGDADRRQAAGGQGVLRHRGGRKIVKLHFCRD